MQFVNLITIIIFKSSESIWFYFIFMVSTFIQQNPIKRPPNFKRTSRIRFWPFYISELFRADGLDVPQRTAVQQLYRSTRSDREAAGVVNQLRRRQSRVVGKCRKKIRKTYRHYYCRYRLNYIDVLPQNYNCTGARPQTIINN